MPHLQYRCLTLIAELTSYLYSPITWYPYLQTLSQFTLPTLLPEALIIPIFQFSLSAPSHPSSFNLAFHFPPSYFDLNLFDLPPFSVYFAHSHISQTGPKQTWFWLLDRLINLLTSSNRQHLLFPTALQAIYQCFETILAHLCAPHAHPFLIITYSLASDTIFSNPPHLIRS